MDEGVGGVVADDVASVPSAACRSSRASGVPRPSRLCRGGSDEASVNEAAELIGGDGLGSTMLNGWTRAVGAVSSDNSLLPSALSRLLTLGIDAAAAV